MIKIIVLLLIIVSCINNIHGYFYCDTLSTTPGQITGTAKMQTNGRLAEGSDDYTHLLSSGDFMCGYNINSKIVDNGSCWQRPGTGPQFSLDRYKYRDVYFILVTHGASVGSPPTYALGGDVGSEISCGIYLNNTLECIDRALTAADVILDINDQLGNEQVAKVVENTWQNFCVLLVNQTLYCLKDGGRKYNRFKPGQYTDGINYANITTPYSNDITSYTGVTDVHGCRGSIFFKDDSGLWHWLTWFPDDYDEMYNSDNADTRISWPSNEIESMYGKQFPCFVFKNGTSSCIGWTLIQSVWPPTLTTVSYTTGEEDPLFHMDHDWTILKSGEYWENKNRSNTGMWNGLAESPITSADYSAGGQAAGFCYTTLSILLLPGTTATMSENFWNGSLVVQLVGNVSGVAIQVGQNLTEFDTFTVERLASNKLRVNVSIDTLLFDSFTDHQLMLNVTKNGVNNWAWSLLNIYYPQITIADNSIKNCGPVPGDQPLPSNATCRGDLNAFGNASHHLTSRDYFSITIDNWLATEIPSLDTVEFFFETDTALFIPLQYTVFEDNATVLLDINFEEQEWNWGRIVLRTTSQYELVYVGKDKILLPETRIDQIYSKQDCITGKGQGKCCAWDGKNVINCPVNGLDKDNNPVVMNVDGWDFIETCVIKLDATFEVNTLIKTNTTYLSFALPQQFVGSYKLRVVCFDAKFTSQILDFSYSPPEVTRISSTQYSSGNEISLMNLPRDEAQINITLTGINFHSERNLIFIGASECENPQNVNNTNIDCTLPHDLVKSSSIAVRVIQAGGFPQFSKFTIGFRECEQGTVHNETTKQCEPCPVGWFARYGDAFCTPCTVGTYNDDIGQGECKKCLTQTGGGEIECPSCTINEFTEEGVLGCRQCDEGTEYLNYTHRGTWATPVPNNHNPCISCPENVVCSKGRASAVRGYWLLVWKKYGNVSAHKCVDQESCKLVQSTYENKCKSAKRVNFTENFLCRQCTEGYYEWNNICVECDGYSLGFMLLTVVIIVVWTIILHKTFSTDQKGDTNAIVRSSIVKILIYFTQTISLVYSKHISAFTLFSMSAEQAEFLTFGGDCPAPIDAYDKLSILTMIIPLCIFGLLLLSFIVAKIYAATRSSVKDVEIQLTSGDDSSSGSDSDSDSGASSVSHMSQSITKNRTELNVLKHVQDADGEEKPSKGIMTISASQNIDVRYFRSVSSGLLYTVTLIVIGLLKYEDCDDSIGDYNYNVYYPSIDCSDAKFRERETLIILTLCGALFFTLLLFLYLWKSRNLIKGSGSKYTEKQSLTVSRLEVFHICYSRKYYYWEFIIFLRRIIISSLYLIIKSWKGDNEGYVWFQVLNVLALLYHVVAKPFRHRFSNTLETISLGLLIVLASLSNTQETLIASTQVWIVALVLIFFACLSACVAFPARSKKWFDKMSSRR